ncbi:MAG: hypothetical protein MJY49_05610 [Bacteroidales bacterium]|nr:hypothetical protein [Bacteroidales bacterium]
MNKIQQEIIMDHTVALVEAAMKEFGLSFKEALSLVIQSDTFALLENPASGEYENGFLYILDDFKAEIKYGKIQ